MDNSLNVVMVFVFGVLGIVSFVATDIIRRCLGSVMIRNEERLRRVPIFGLFVRSLIFSFESGGGTILICLMGVLWFVLVYLVIAYL